MNALIEQFQVQTLVVRCSVLGILRITVFAWKDYSLCMEGLQSLRGRITVFEWKDYIRYMRVYMFYIESAENQARQRRSDCPPTHLVAEEG